MHEQRNADALNKISIVTLFVRLLIDETIFSHSVGLGGQAAAEQVPTGVNVSGDDINSCKMRRIFREKRSFLTVKTNFSHEAEEFRNMRDGLRQ